MSERRGPQGVDLGDVQETIDYAEKIAGKLTELKAIWNSKGNAERIRALADELDNLMRAKEAVQLEDLEKRVLKWHADFMTAGADLDIDSITDERKFIENVKDIFDEIDTTVGTIKP